MATDVDYVNRALAKLAVDPIVALSNDDSQTAAIALPLYEKCLEELLGCHSWRFAVTRVELSKLSIPPTNTDYAFQYAVPVEILRIVRTNNRRDDWMLYRDAGSGYRRLLSNRDGLSLDAVFRPDAALFPTHFQRAFVAALASELAIPLTRRLDIAQAYAAEAERAKSDAITQDWNEQPMQELDDGDWLTNAKYVGSSLVGG